MKIRVILAVLGCLFVTAPLLAQGPPEASGPYVVRDEVSGYWWYFTDFKRGYVVFLGVDIVSWCAEMPVYSTWSLQENYPPAEEGLVVQHFKGDDVITSVWPITIWDGDPCEYVFNNPPIADGTADVIANDNDLYAGSYDHNRHNSYGISAHGVLTAPDGERMIFNGMFHCTWPGYPDFDEGKCKIKIVLN
jgi:hypothetical protein